MKEKNVKQNNGLAIAGFVCSLYGLITCGITSVIGLVLSIIGLNKSKELNGKNKGMAIAGIVISAIIIIIYVIMMFFAGTTMAYLKNRVTDGVKNSIINEKKSVNKTFEFEDLEITVSDTYTFDTIENSFSEYNGRTVIVIPVTVKNIDDEENKLNMFYYNFYGPNGTRLNTVSSYFYDESLDFADDLQPNDSYTKNFYLLYEEDGTYAIEFNNYEDQIKIELDVKK